MSIDKKYCTKHVDTTSRLIAQHVIGSVDAPLDSLKSQDLPSDYYQIPPLSHDLSGNHSQDFSNQEIYRSATIHKTANQEINRFINHKNCQFTSFILWSIAVFL